MQFQKNIPFSNKTVLILLMSAFCEKYYTFTQINSVRAVLEIFLLYFQFFYDKTILLMKM